MSQADQIASGKKTPKWLAAAIADVAETVARNSEGTREALRLGPRIRRGIDRQLEAGVIDKGEHSLRVAHDVMTQEEHDHWFEHSSYAYRFEFFDDGSALAIYVRRSGEDVELRAFDSQKDAADWHPDPRKSNYIED